MTCPLCKTSLIKSSSRNGLSCQMCPNKELILGDHTGHFPYSINHYLIYITDSLPKVTEQKLYIYPYHLIIFDNSTSIYSYTNDNRGSLVISIPHKLDVLLKEKMLNKIETIVLFS